MFSLTKNKTAGLFVLSAIIFFLIFFFVKDLGLVVDEKWHYPQIKMFLDGDYSLHPRATIIPTYHAVLAFFGKIFGIDSLAGLRFVSSIFSFLSILIFYFLARKIHNEGYLKKTLEYALIPALLPFFFLLYSDVFSLLAVLSALLFTLRKRYGYGALFAILSVLTRQMNIVWLVFMIAIAYVEEFGMELKIKNLKEILKKCWLFELGIMAFLIFVFINGGVALRDASSHPLSIYFGNIFVTLILFFFLFLPLALSKSREIIDLVKNHWKIVLVAGIAMFSFYMFGFENTHIFNLVLNPEKFRNTFLHFLTSSVLIKALFFLPMGYSILTIFAAKLKQPSFYLLYPFSILVLMPSWFITWRYSLIFFALVTLFRERESDKVENFTIVYCVIFAIISFFAMFKGVFLFV